MKKIAIVACLQANEVCAGCGCLNAFQDRTQNFERYVGEEVRLAAFMRCSHCIRKEGDPLANAGFVEKLERMASEGVEIVHIGVCAGRNAESACPGMLKMIEAFEDKDMKTAWGTH